MLDEPTNATDTPAPSPGAPPPGPARAPATVASASTADAGRREGGVWRPSRRLTVVLAAAMLAVGVAVGAAIGPAPEASFAGASALPSLLPSLIAQAAGSAAKPGPASGSQPAGGETVPATPTRRRHRRAAAAASSGAAAASAPASEPASASESPASSGAKPTSGQNKAGGEGATRPLPPITKVWLIELSGSTFGEALAAPASAPYIDSHAVPSGALLSAWSALEASAFASDAALIATNEARLTETILQPTCPEGAAGASCAAGTPGAVKSADEFLQQTLTTITASGSYRTSGLVVVTFGAIAAGASSELAAGSTTATLTSQPPAGALLISPFVTAGKRPSTTLNPSSPRQSLEALLHR